jgi:hypothetical protein
MGRHRFLENAFTLVSGLVLAALAFKLASIGLAFLAFLALMTFPYRAKLRKFVDEVRGAHGTLPSTPDAVSDDQLEALDAAAIRMHPEQQIAQRHHSIRNLWERLAIAPPTMFTSLAIVGTWLVAVVGLVVAVKIYAVAMPREEDIHLSPGTADSADSADSADTAGDVVIEPAPSAAPLTAP